MENDFELPVVVFDSLNDALKSYLLNSGFAAFIPDQLMRKNIVDGWTHPAAAAAAATKSQKSQKPYFQKSFEADENWKQTEQFRLSLCCPVIRGGTSLGLHSDVRPVFDDLKAQPSPSPK